MCLIGFGSETDLRSRVARVKARKEGVRRARGHDLEDSRILQRCEGGDEIPTITMLESVESVSESRAMHLGGKRKPLVILGSPNLSIGKPNE